MGVSLPPSNLAPQNMPYLEGQGDLVSNLRMGIIRVTIWVIGVINLLTKSADSPSTRTTVCLKMFGKGMEELQRIA